MKDLAPLYRDRTGRRHTERNGLWYFACGFGWAFVLVVIVEGIA